MTVDRVAGGIGRTLRRVLHAGDATRVTELVAAVVVGGVVLAVVWHYLSLSRHRGAVAAMRSDLQRVALHQTSIRRDQAVYSSDVLVLETRGLQLSAGVQIAIREATSRGWSASASHAATTVRCYLFTGDAAPVGVASTVGEIACA